MLCYAIAMSSTTSLKFHENAVWGPRAGIIFIFSFLAIFCGGEGVGWGGSGNQVISLTPEQNVADCSQEGVILPSVFVNAHACDQI